MPNYSNSTTWRCRVVQNIVWLFHFVPVYKLFISSLIAHHEITWSLNTSVLQTGQFQLHGSLPTLSLTRKHSRRQNPRLDVHNGRTNDYLQSPHFLNYSITFSKIKALSAISVFMGERNLYHSKLTCCTREGYHQSGMKQTALQSSLEQHILPKKENE